MAKRLIAPGSGKRKNRRQPASAAGQALVSLTQSGPAPLDFAPLLAQLLDAEAALSKARDDSAPADYRRADVEYQRVFEARISMERALLSGAPSSARDALLQLAIVRSDLESDLSADDLEHRLAAMDAALGFLVRHLDVDAKAAALLPYAPAAVGKGGAA